MDVEGWPLFEEIIDAFHRQRGKPAPPLYLSAALNWIAANHPRAGEAEAAGRWLAFAGSYSEWVAAGRPFAPVAAR